MSARESAFELIRVLSEGEPYARVRCPECHGQLVVHQPDERLPDRLLGTCRACLAWFLLNAGGEILFRLPDVDALKVAGAISWAGRSGRARAAPDGVHRLHGPEGNREKRPGSRRPPSRTDQASGRERGD